MARLKKLTIKEQLNNIKTSFKELKWYEIIMIIIMIIIASIAVVEAIVHPENLSPLELQYYHNTYNLL